MGGHLDIVLSGKGGGSKKKKRKEKGKGTSSGLNEAEPEEINTAT